MNVWGKELKENTKENNGWKGRVGDKELFATHKKNKRYEVEITIIESPKGS